MNNHWTSNFNADQHGAFEWTYYLTSSNDNSIEFATRFAWGNRIPLPVRVLQPGKTTTQKRITGSLFEIIPDNLLLVNMRPVEGENAVMLQMREIGGKQAVFDAQSSVIPGALRFEICDANGNPVGKTGQISFKPWENKFIKIMWN
jgi:alpha-mannosidase